MYTCISDQPSIIVYHLLTNTMTKLISLRRITEIQTSISATPIHHTESIPRSQESWHDSTRISNRDYKSHDVD